MSTTQDPAPDTQAASPGQPAGEPRAHQYIPLRAADLVDSLARDPGLSPAQEAAFRRLCQRIQALLHHEFQGALEDLKNAYAPFDPDSDTGPGAELTPEAKETCRQRLFDRFGWLLARGNFVRLGQHEIEAALNEHSHWGLNLAIDFKIFDRLEVYCRGDSIDTRYRRRLRTRLRSEAVQVPTYQRLVVIFRLRPIKGVAQLLDTDDVYIKLFKDIPKVDLEMLLPGTQVKMSLFDRAKIALPTLSGLSMAGWKLVQALFFATAAGVYGSLAILGLVGGTLGYGARSFYGYLNTKQKYQLSLTQSLYYQNLDNNAGVIYRLLGEAEEQEHREALLAYFFLWRKAPAEGWTPAELDAQIEALLLTTAGQPVDFEVDDALEKLQRLELIQPGEGDQWKALPIERAIEVLGARWRDIADCSDRR